MKKSGIIVLLFMILAPSFALAQASDADWQHYWGTGSQYASQIQALGAIPVASFPIPVLLGVEVAQLTKNFGDPRGDGTRTHEGLDIMAPSGTPVVSPTDAVVLSTGTGADSGLYVRTANPGDEQFVYMHLREIAQGIQTGTILKRDDVLGYVGNTGNAAGGPTHLHFEVRKNGATDPFPRLTQVFSLQERMNAVSQALERTTDPTSLAATLASNFKSTFTTAKTQGISIAQSILSNLGSDAAVAVPTAEAATAPAAYTLTSAANTGVASATYSRDLEKGMKGEDVRKLQKYLNANGYLITNIGDGSPGYETTFFGALTQKALATFQSAKGISPSVGYFGPKTRAYVNAH